MVRVGVEDAELLVFSCSVDFDTDGLSNSLLGLGGNSICRGCVTALTTPCF